MTIKTHYDVLGVTPDADDTVIRAAYLALMRKFHPDINADAADRARDIGAAFTVLGRRDTRDAYDRDLARQAAPPVITPSPPEPEWVTVDRHAGPGEPLTGEWLRADMAELRVRRNGWLVPMTGLLIAVASLMSTYAFLRGAEIGNATGEIVSPGEDGGSANAVEPVEQRPIPSLANLGNVAPPTPSPDAADTPPGVAEEPILAEDVARAVGKFNQIKAMGGMGAVRAFSQKCSRSARRANRLQAVDYCVAFDYAAMRAVDGQPVVDADVAPYRIRTTADSGSSRRRKFMVEVNADPHGQRLTRLKALVDRDADPVTLGNS